MNIFFYGNCQMRQIYRIIDFLLEPYQHTLIYINDIDRIEEEHLPIIYACLEKSDVVITTFVITSSNQI